MDIYILRDGAQTGPFSEEQVQAFLKQGSTLINDLAWTPGALHWQPLHAVLYPAAQPTVPPPPPTDLRPPAMPENPILASEEAPAAQPASLAKPPRQLDPKPPGEPATPRQKAFLTYLSLPFSSDLTKERAALLVNDAMEDSKNAARIKRWDEERLRLYPDLFADEVKARKENRPQHYLEVCLGEGADYFEGVTKAHTQVLVGYLDVHHPSWEQNLKTAKVDYFFPALSEKFPQLLKKGAKGRFKFADGPKVAAELVRSPAAARSRPGRSPVAAAMRGMFVGIVVLGLAFAAYQVNTGAWKLPASVTGSGAKADAKPSPAAVNTAGNTQPAASTGDPRIAQATPKPIQPGTDSGAKPPADPPLVASLNPATVPAPPDPVPGADPAKPAMTDPPPAPIPDGSLFAPPPVPPVPPPADPAANGAPAPAAHPTIVRITKATVVPVKFGSLPLRPGTPIQVLSVDATHIRAKVGSDTIAIPIANTDYVAEGAPAALPPP
jgi:hypothetical protein